MRSRRRGVALLAVAAVAAALATAAGSANARQQALPTRQPGTLTVGVDIGTIGLAEGEIVNGKIVRASGFEIGLARKLAARLHLKLRVVDVPFETCVAAFDSWLPTMNGGELRIGGSRLLGPMEHDRELGTRRIQVRLARGAMYPTLRMRLEIDRWSSSSTALELIPDRLVRPTADYFRAGRLLLDSLTRSLPQRPESSIAA